MFRVTGDDRGRKVERNLFGLKDITVRGKRQAFYKIGALAKSTIVRNISAKPRAGRLEKYNGRRRRASVAGESFANKSGAAKKTLGFEVRGSTELEFGFRENAETIYTKILEESKDRPTLKIASKSIVGNAQTIMINELKKAHDQGFK